MTPMKAIRLKCLDCMNGSHHEIRLCPCVKCPLYLYRFGKRPKTDRDTGEGANELDTPAISPVQASDGPEL